MCCRVPERRKTIFSLGFPLAATAIAVESGFRHARREIAAARPHSPRRVDVPSPPANTSSGATAHVLQICAASIFIFARQTRAAFASLRAVARQQ
jgi:hypothetical protein